MSDVMGTTIEDGFKLGGIHRQVISMHSQVIEDFIENPDVQVTEILEQMNSNIGCRVSGTVEIAKVPGHFQFTTNRNKALSEALRANNYPVIFSHAIRKLRFGDETEEVGHLKQRFSFGHNWSPLQGTIGMHPMVLGHLEVGYYSGYYMDVTPIALIDLDKNKYQTL